MGQAVQHPADSESLPVSSRHNRIAWAVHFFTAMGAVVGMLAIEAVFKDKVKTAMVYLLITQVIDGVDGPMARQIDIVRAAPKIDGYVMDLVIDYLTCVIVPAAFMNRFGLFPSHLSIPMICLIVFVSAMWFSRTDMMTDDLWFNGFPSTWNLIAPTLYLLGTPDWANVIACVGLCGLLMTNIKFPHPMRSGGPRSMTIMTLVATGLWLVALLWGAFDPTLRNSAKAILVLVIGYFAGLSAWRTRLERVRRPAAQPVSE
jgi:phosphatidylcholine synthase